MVLNVQCNFCCFRIVSKVRTCPNNYHQDNGTGDFFKTGFQFHDSVGYLWHKISLGDLFTSHERLQILVGYFFQRHFMYNHGYQKSIPDLGSETPQKPDPILRPIPFLPHPLSYPRSLCTPPPTNKNEFTGRVWWKVIGRGFCGRFRA